jgi:ketosteroid isomerase-like protein
LTSVLSYGAKSSNRLKETSLEGVEGARSALETFYYALNNRDAATLEAVWGATPSVVLYNPLGGVVRGRGAIAGLYRRVFESGRALEVSFGDVIEFSAPDHAIFVGRETGSYLAPDGTRVPLYIRTSRYFLREEGAWRQYHHHGSIDDPEALVAYQAAVIGQGPF